MERTVRCPINFKVDTSGILLSGTLELYSRMVHSDGLGAGGAAGSVLGISSFLLSVSGPLVASVSGKT